MIDDRGSRLAQNIPDHEIHRPTPGQSVIIGLGLSIGILLMAMQLWLLTLAFDLYLSDEPERIIALAAISGLVFLGGLFMLRFLDRKPRRRG